MTKIRVVIFMTNGKTHAGIANDLQDRTVDEASQAIRIILQEADWMSLVVSDDKSEVIIRVRDIDYVEMQVVV